MHKIDYQSASSDAIVATLGRRLDALRLSRNISQADLARKAGVSRSTMTRLADGKGVSLDSFVRVMQALQLADRLAAMLPDPGVRPVERLRFSGRKRQRASTRRTPPRPWQWGDEEPGS